MKKPRRSLAEFAGQPGARRHVCWVCSLPERADIDRGKLEGYRMDQIVGWLQNVCGYKEASVLKVQTHFMSKHHLAARRA